MKSLLRHLAAVAYLSNGSAAFHSPPVHPLSPKRWCRSTLPKSSGLVTPPPPRGSIGRPETVVRLSSSALERNNGGVRGAEEDEDGVREEVRGGGAGEFDFDGDYEDFEPNADSGDADIDDDDDDDDDDDESPVSPARRLYDALSASIDRATTAVEKKSRSLRRELDKAKDLEATMARANLIVSNLYRLPPGTTSATVEDWDNDGIEIELILETDKYASAQEESDALFAAARKMKRGSRVVEELLDKTDGAVRVLSDGRMDLDAAANRGPDGGPDEGMLVLIQERMERAASQTGFKMASLDDDGGKQKRRRQQGGNGTGGGKRSTRYQPTFRRLTSPSGLRVLVGRNRRDNEAICFQVARGDDVWMHARGCPGAHVLLQVRRGDGQATDADLQFAADLAAFYSDARTERRAAVTVAEPKHIQKPRGAPPGAVKLRKEGPSLVGRPEDVAEELKVAREESGGAWDEMGYQKLGGRARNKKRTEEARKKTMAKKRAEKRQKRRRKHRSPEGEDGSDWS